MTVQLAETGFIDLEDKVVVSPAFGRVVLGPTRPRDADGALVRAGDLICEIESSSGPVPVVAPCDAWLLDVLVCDGDRVRPGRPLVYLRAL